MAKVYRIEHCIDKSNEIPHYHGPYRNYHDYEYTIFNLMQSVPLPSEWFGSLDWSERTRYIFAFRNIEDMMKYFTPTVQSFLAEKGFVISVYVIADNYITGDEIQVAFPYDKASVVQRLQWQDEYTTTQQLKVA